MSKPATQKVTAAVRRRMRGSREPRTAIQAADGAMPSANPRTRGDPRGERVVEEEGRSTERARGESHRVRRFSCDAATIKMAQETMTKLATKARERCPEGSARVAVRGLAASMAESARRLKAMAAERAATMAMMIQRS